MKKITIEKLEYGDVYIDEWNCLVIHVDFETNSNNTKVFRDTFLIKENCNKYCKRKVALNYFKKLHIYDSFEIYNRRKKVTVLYNLADELKLYEVK